MLDIPSYRRPEQRQEVTQGEAILVLHSGQRAQQRKHHHCTLGQRLEEFAQAFQSVKVVECVGQTVSDLERDKNKLIQQSHFNKLNDNFTGGFVY